MVLDTSCRGSPLPSPAKDAPKISVVIPLYNKEESIERTLKSVLMQTVQDFEIVVVDDGSTDAGAEKILRFDDPRIRLIQQENQGVSVARNRGVREAQSELVAFLDADDEWLPTFIETVLRLHKEYPESGLFSTARIDHRPDGTEVLPRIPYVPPPPWEGLLPSYFRAAALSDQPVCSSTVAIPRSVLDEVGGFPPDIRVGEDLITWFRIAIRYPIAFTWKACAIYHMESANRTCALADFLKWENDILIAVQQSLQEGSVPADMVADVTEFFASYQISLAYRCISQGALQEARSILASCDTRLFRGERLAGLIAASIPAPLLRCVLQVKHLITLKITEPLSPHIKGHGGAGKVGQPSMKWRTIRSNRSTADYFAKIACSGAYVPASPPALHPGCRGGVALTFDDSENIAEWYSIRTLFLKYGAKVTFFVDRFDEINDADLEKLHALARDGHEIGCHGFRHLKAEEFLQSHSIEEYIRVEIKPAIEAMEVRGFKKPQSFAHPYGSDTWALNVVLAEHFHRLRGIAEYYAPLRKDLRKVNRIFCHSDGAVLVRGTGLDCWYENPVERVVPALERAAARGEVIILYAHKPVPAEDGNFTIPIDKIEAILKYSSDLGLKFYRVCDLGS